MGICIKSKNERINKTSWILETEVQIEGNFSKIILQLNKDNGIILFTQFWVWIDRKSW